MRQERQSGPQCGENGHISKGGRDEEHFPPLSARGWPDTLQLGLKGCSGVLIEGLLSRVSGGSGRQYTFSMSCMDEGTDQHFIRAYSSSSSEITKGCQYYM